MKTSNPIRSMLTILFAVCLCGMPFRGHATGQSGEVIIIGQDTLQMLTCPLEADTTLSRLVDERLGERGINTGLWRGYVGIWRLEEGQLFLEKVIQPVYDITKTDITVDISGIFDAYLENGRIAARWYSGDIRVVRGKRVAYEHIGFSRHYEEETIYKLRAGKVISERQIHNTLADKGREENFRILGLLFNGRHLTWKEDSILMVDLLPNPDGTVDRVTVSQLVKKKGNRWSRKSFEEREAKREKLRARSQKAVDRFFARTSTIRRITYGRRHPYTREVAACAALIDHWKALVLDGKMQPVSFWLRCGGNRAVSNACYHRFESRSDLDTLEVDGEILGLKAYPLQQDPDLITRLRPHLRGGFSSAYPRGYSARWCLEDGRLYLTEIRHRGTGERIPLSVVAPGNQGEPVEATWYSGTFIAETGGPLNDDYYFSDYSRREVECTIEQGRVVHREEYANDIRPGDRESYDRFIATLRSHNWGSYPELKGRTLHGNLMVYPRLDGQADSIRDIELYVNGEPEKKGEPRYHRAVTDPADPWIDLVRRAAETVSRWEVRFLRGKVRPVEIMFDIKKINDDSPKEMPPNVFQVDLRKITGGVVIGE